MNTAATQKPAVTPVQTRAGATDRPNLYVPIHKALRSLMCDTLGRVGRLDVLDTDETVGTLNQVETLLAICLDHIEHENSFMHTAIEARLPAGSTRTGADHAEHVETIAALRDEVAALAAARSEERTNLALRLYRHLALFVADNFQHMHIEETANNAALWAHYDDTELLALHGRLLASIAPHEHLTVARWMVPALDPAGRAAVMAGMRAGAPAEAFRAVVAVVRPHLDDAAWRKLAPAIGWAASVLPQP